MMLARGASARALSRTIRQARFKPARFLSTARNPTPGFWKLSGFTIIAGSAIALYAVSQSIIELDNNNTDGVTVAEVQSHNSVEKGVWVVINGIVYDLTEFISRHPGGAKIILKYAGKDALAIFNKFHAPNFVEKYLTPEECLGPLIGEMEIAADVTESDDPERQDYLDNIPPISQVFNLSDFEYIALKILPPTAWCYYSSGADDEISLRENHNAFSRIFFKPRVLVNGSDVDISTEMLGAQTDAPFYCSAAAQAKLGHPDGELSIARGCGDENVIQMISNFSSYPLEDIIGQTKDQTQWFQLYVSDDKQCRDDIKQCNDQGIKAIFVTVDTPELGRREKDMKLRAAIEMAMDENKGDNDALGSAVVYGKDTSVTWDNIADFKKQTNLPIVIKGVQCVEDVVLAAENGVKAVVLSNHGGRQLDYARAPIEVLADCYPVLRAKGLEDKIEIYIDGGVRRGSDVIKCLALGAKGVGLGRVFLYSNAAYGEQGVKKAIELLKEEIRLDMRLLGVSKVSELGPQHLDLRNLYSRSAPSDNLYNSNYQPLQSVKFGNE